MSKTIKSLVYDVTSAVQNMGMDVSPADVGTILSLFFDGLAGDPTAPQVDEWLSTMSAECASVTNE